MVFAFFIRFFFFYHFTYLGTRIQLVKTCIKRSPLEQRKNGLLRQLTSWKRLNSYEIFYDRTRKRWPFNTGDCLASLTVHVLYITSTTISNWKLNRQGVCNTLIHAICVTDDQGNVPFVVVIIMSFLSRGFEVFFYIFLKF